MTKKYEYTREEMKAALEKYRPPPMNRAPRTRAKTMEELVEAATTEGLREFQDFYEESESQAIRDLFSEAYDLTLLELMNRAANRED
jgi:hypothetical protein